MQQGKLGRHPAEHGFTAGSWLRFVPCIEAQKSGDKFGLPLRLVVFLSPSVAALSLCFLDGEAEQKCLLRQSDRQVQPAAEPACPSLGCSLVAKDPPPPGAASKDRQIPFLLPPLSALLEASPQMLGSEQSVSVNCCWRRGCDLQSFQPLGRS